MKHIKKIRNSEKRIEIGIRIRIDNKRHLLSAEDISSNILTIIVQQVVNRWR